MGEMSSPEDHRTHEGGNEMRELMVELQHIGIPTTDMEATKAFYEKLGFEIAFETINDGARVIFFRFGNITLETYESADAAHKVGAIDHLAITVTDIEAAYDWICKAGLNTMDDSIHFLPFWEKGVRFFTIMGPNAEKVEFSQYL